MDVERRDLICAWCAAHGDTGAGQDVDGVLRCTVCEQQMCGTCGVTFNRDADQPSCDGDGQHNDAAGYVGKHVIGAGTVTHIAPALLDKMGGG